MTSSTFSQMPITIANSAFGGIKSALLWVVSRFFAKPLQNFALVLLTLAMAVSLSNALFWQSGVHPAPLFGEQQNFVATSNNSTIASENAPHPRETTIARQQKVVSPAQPLQQPIPRPVTPTRPISVSEVTNEILAMAQTSLSQMGLFTGKVDGFYGPLTATAIREFERQQGLVVKGAMTPQIIEKIINFNSSANNANPAATPGSPQIVTQTQTATRASATEQPHIDEPSQAVTDALNNDVIANIVSSIPPAPTQVQNPAQEQAQITASAAPAVLAAPAVQAASVTSAYNPQTDKELIEKIQRGLSSLGFYYSAIDGVVNESTARAIREFENFKSFEMTGEVSTQLLLWLQESGAIT